MENKFILSNRHYKTIYLSLHKLLNNPYFFHTFESISNLSSISLEKNSELIQEELDWFIKDLMFFNILSCKKGDVIESENRLKHILSDYSDEKGEVIPEIHLIKLLDGVRNNLDFPTIQEYLSKTTNNKSEIDNLHFLTEISQILEERFVRYSKDYAKVSYYLW